MSATSTPQRQESDRHQKKTWLTALISRPEIGPTSGLEISVDNHVFF